MSKKIYFISNNLKCSEMIFQYYKTQKPMYFVNKGEVRHGKFKRGMGKNCGNEVEN